MSESTLAVWVVTPNGLQMAHKIIARLGPVDLFVADGLSDVPSAVDGVKFKRLSDALGNWFDRYEGHIFIMATGIVVRLVAGLLRHKSGDPAVVVMDEKGRHAISLLSGHLGGANRLTRRVARATGAEPVITTATDVNQVPSIDVIAVQCGLKIENPPAIKTINMAWLTGQAVALHDPYGLLRQALPRELITPSHDRSADENIPTVVVDDVVADTGPYTLVLRPKVLAVGIGCNRNTSKAELHNLLTAVLDRYRLSVSSLICLASIDVKSDEAGLLQLADVLGVPLRVFDRRELDRVEGISCTSKTVAKHVGARNVCEAAAILAADRGQLIVPKQITKNATLAVARTAFSSSASARATPTTCRRGPWKC